MVLVLIACAIISAVQIVSSYAVSGRIFNLGIFQRTEDIEFSDYFHTNDMIAENNPYIAEMSSYPPFVFMIARIFALFGDYSNGYESMIDQPIALAGFFIFYALCYIGIIYLSAHIMRSRGLSKGFTAAACFIIAYNAPMLFNFERGNYIICAFLFSIAFYAFYDDETRILREFSYIFLAFAAGIKLYPALLAVVLLRERRICDFLRCAAYSVLIIIISFLTFEGGFSGIPQFFHWLGDFSGSITDYGYNYSIASFIGAIAALFGGSPWSLPPVLAAMQTSLPYILLAVCVIFSFLVDKQWKILALVSIAIIQFPNISFAYALMFMIIPLIAFFLEREKTKRDYIYMALMIIILSPIYLGMALPTYGININQIVSSIAIIALEAALIVEAAVRIIKSARAYRINGAEKVLKDI